MDFDFTYIWASGGSFREEAVNGTYDLKDVKLEKHIRGSIILEKLIWQIGVIVGSSGMEKQASLSVCGLKRILRIFGSGIRVAVF
jgi:hypothetical protein